MISRTAYRWSSALAIVAGLTLVGACSGDGDSPLSSLDLPGRTSPVETTPPGEPPAEEPAPEPPAEEPAPEPPAEEPAPEPTVPEEPEEAPSTTQNWTLLLVLGVIVISIIMAVAAFGKRRGKTQAIQQTTHQPHLDDITRSCRSIHDSYVISVLQATDPFVLQSTWATARTQFADTEARIAVLQSELSDLSQQATMRELGQALAGLRGALESNVALRLDPQGPATVGLVEASSRTVLNRNEQLESTLQRALYMRV